MSTGKTPRWESELWSYISQGDGQHCPNYSHCKVRLQGDWCADKNKRILEQLYGDDHYRPEKYCTLENATHSAASGMSRRIEMLAWKYLRKGEACYPPVPMELALLSDEHNVVEVRMVPLKTHSGALWRLNDEWIIYLSSNDPPSRQRFTLFHEVFHILAHKAIPTPIFSKRGVEQGSFNELMADYFASCVLMPKKQVCEKWAVVKDLDKMAEIFAVPKAAMWFRLKLMGLL